MKLLAGKKQQEYPHDEPIIYQRLLDQEARVIQACDVLGRLQLSRAQAVPTLRRQIDRAIVAASVNLGRACDAFTDISNEWYDNT